MARRKNPHRLDDRLESHLQSFMERADKLSDLGWRLHSHLRPYPELAKAVKLVAEACDDGVMTLDSYLDESE